MEDKTNNKELLKEKQDAELNKKFTRILEMDNKSKKFDEFLLLKGKNLNSFTDLLNTLEEKLKRTCSENMEKLIAFSKRIDEKNNIMAPEKGYEEEFKQAEFELVECVNQYNVYRDSLENDFVNLKRLTMDSYNLCNESCKEEMKNKNLNENITRNCLNGCYRFLLMNKEIFNDIVYEKLEFVKDDISKANI